MKHIIIINGPNLNLLGSRENNIYGTFTLKSLEELCQNAAKELNLKLAFIQTNSESKIINLIQKAPKQYSGIIINPAGFSHTSVAILDALLAVKIPKIEVHLSNIYKREEFRNKSYISKATNGVIIGLGALGYVCALYAIENIIK